MACLPPSTSPHPHAILGRSRVSNIAPLISSPCSAHLPRRVAFLKSPWFSLMAPSPRSTSSRGHLINSDHLRHVDSMANLPSGAGQISRLNAVILGEALASEENDLVIPSEEFRKQALVSSMEQDTISKYSTKCEVEWVDAEDPLFLLYTSGSTGKPKGVLHTTGGYMIYSATTFKYAFDYKSSDVYWYVGLFKVPTYPDAGRCWEIVDKYKVTIFYTAPTLVRSLMRDGDEIGAFATPDRIHWAPGLPKTRSGKIMRRILRKIASRQFDELGDTSTLADPSVVDQLIALCDV